MVSQAGVKKWVLVLNGRSQRVLVAQSGPSHQAENPLTPFPAPPLAAAIGGALFRAQPPASRPPKGDWPVEADLARLTLPGQPSISGFDHPRHQEVRTMRILGFRLRGLAMTLSGGAMVVVVCCESATHRLTLLPGHLLDKGWPPVGGSLLGQIRSATLALCGHRPRQHLQ